MLAWVRRISLVACMGVAGCASGSPNPPSASPNPIDVRLASAAEKAAAALRSLAEVEQAREPKSDVADVNTASLPPELTQLVTVTWVGPMEPLIGRLARRAGYDVKIVGSAPPSKIVVDVDASQQMLVDLFRNVGVQVGSRADLVIDPARRVVEIRYAPDA